MTFKVIQGHQNCRYLIGHILLVSNNDSILHRFRDITTFTVYVTACDLEKWFSIDKTLELQVACDVCFPVADLRQKA